MKVLVSLNIPDVGIDLLRKEKMEVMVWTNDLPMTPDQLIQNAKKHDALLCTGADTIDKRFLNACSHLKIISQFAAGYDNIDVNEARQLGIPIGYAPDAMTESTADVAFMLMLAASRKMCFNHKRILKGEWAHFRPRAFLGMELKGKTLGIFGMGRIGMAMARRCQGAYGMNIIYHNRSRNREAENSLGAEYVAFADLLRRSDVLSVHSVLSEATSGIFDKTAFQQMKETAIFVNTARGRIHQESDLIAALQQGHIWGAGLDVTNPEPMLPDNPLLNMENVAITPHIGSATVEARNEMSRVAADNIVRFFRGEKVENLVSQ